MRTNGGQQSASKQIATGLGWFSIGLGVAEMAAPDAVARLVGVRSSDDRTRNLLRCYGMREIAAGVGILSGRAPSAWLWSRVGGDLLDLATLGRAASAEDTDRTRLCAASAAVAGVTALDVYCARQMSNGHSALSRAGWSSKAADRQTVTETIIVNRSREDVYRFWRNFENLPRFMSHLEEVRTTGDRRSHWVARGPLGKRVEWDAEITSDLPSDSISWQSLPGAFVENSGTVRFERAPGGRGTQVRVELSYAMPGGNTAATLAKLFVSEPGQMVKGDLRRFKQVMETGEVVHSDSSIHRSMHPARPAKNVPVLEGR